MAPALKQTVHVLILLKATSLQIVITVLTTLIATGITANPPLQQVSCWLCGNVPRLLSSSEQPSMVGTLYPTADRGCMVTRGGYPVDGLG